MNKWATALLLLSLGIGIGATRRSDAQSLKDILPTELGVAGVIASSACVDGMSLMISALAQRAAAKPRPAARGMLRFAGLIFYPNDRGRVAFDFAELSESEAEAISVGANERVAFNSELGQVNALRGDVTLQTVREMATGRILSPSEVGAFARELWERGRLTLSTPTRSALEKIAKNMAREL